jgi:hypothetical protein
LFTSIECISILVVYPLPPKGGSKTAIFLAPFRGFGGKKGRMRNLLKYDQRCV